MSDPKSRLRKLILAELDRLSEQRFAKLRRIPSTDTWKTVDYVSSLGESERGELFQAFASNGLSLFEFAGHPLATAYSDAPAFKRMLEWMPLHFDWKHEGARYLRAALADRKSARPLGIGVGMPEVIVRAAEAIRPTTSVKIRKAIHEALRARYGAQAENLGGGNWIYQCTDAHQPFSLSIDYGGRDDQLRYSVFYEHADSGIRAVHLSYERMLGMGFGNWDFVTEDNLNESVMTLCDLVSDLVRIPSRIKPGDLS